MSGGLTVAELLVKFSGDPANLTQAARASSAEVDKLVNKLQQPIPNPGAKQAVKLSQQELANLQFQVNDMATGLASGQSPFTVMMQQGMQMAQMFKAEAGVVGALKAVGTGITTFLTNPLNLAVLGAGLAASAIAAIATAVTSSFPSASDQIEKHAELIKHIGENWDASRQKVKDYGIETRNSMLFASQMASVDLRKALTSEVSGLASGPQRYQGRVLGGVSDVDLQRVGNDALRQTVQEFWKSVKSGTADVMAFREEILKIGVATDDPRVDGLVQRLLENTKDAATLQDEYKQNQDVIKGLSGDTEKLNEALGKGSDKVNGLTTALNKMVDGKAFAAAQQPFAPLGGAAQSFAARWTGKGTATGLAAAPDGYRSFILDAAQAYGLDPDTLARQIFKESGFNPNAVSGKGAMGLMQLRAGTARDLAVTNPFDPRSNIMGGARYMASLTTQFAGNQELALMAYNWGQGNVRKWQAAGADPNAVPAETRDYVAAITGGGMMGKASSAADKNAAAEKEKLIAQDKRWAEVIRGATSAEQARAEAIGQSAGEQAKLRAETELWDRAHATYGDRLDKDKALLARVTAEIDKQTAAVQRRTQAEADSTAMKEGAARMEQQRIAQMDQIREIGSGIVSTLFQAKDAGQSWGSAMNSVLDSVKSKAASFLDNMINNLLFGKKGGEDGGLLGGLGKGLMDMFTNLGNGPAPSLYAKGAAFGGGVEMFANGAAFSNSVVTRPTLFRFGQRLGVMGERAPEAIMPLMGGMVRAHTGRGETQLPLRRMADGALGVSLPTGFATGDVFGSLPRGSSAGAGGEIRVNAVTHNYSGEKVQTRAKHNSQGGIDIEVLVGEAVNRHLARGGADDTLTSRFDGLTRRTNAYG